MANVVVKDNALINASYSLSLVEQRLLLLSIIEARESGKGITANNALVIDSKSYQEQFNVHRNAAYQALKIACKDIFARQFTFQEVNDKGSIRTVLSRWVSQIAYNENEATVELIFAPAVVPLIIRLEERFTQYDIEQVTKFTSGYSMRLFELLMQWKSLGKTPVLTVDDLRDKLGVAEGEYPRSDNLRRRVIDFAVNQVNSCSDYIVKSKQHKQGRFITGYSFAFKQKKQAIQREATDTSTIDLFTNLSSKQISLFASALCDDPAFGNTFAEVGETTQSFKARVVNELHNPEKLKLYSAHLARLGFNIKTTNSSKVS